MKKLLLLTTILNLLVLTTYAQGPGGIDTTNMTLWVKSDRGVVFDSDSNITRWTDQSNYGNHLDSAGLGKMPNFIYQSATYNNQNVIKFSGDSFDVLKSAQLTSSYDMSGGGWSLFLFFQYNKGTSQTGAGWFSCADTASAPKVQLRLSGNNFRIEGDNQGGNSTPMGSSVMSAPIVYTLVRDVVNGTVVENQSGVETINKSFGGTAAYQVDLFKLGENYDATSFSDMEVTEVIFLNRTASTMEVTMIENYFASKYGATITGVDYYIGDETAQGDYDYDIAGIGTNGTDTVYTASGAGLKATIQYGFSADDYFFFGHKTDSNYRDFTDTAGIGGTEPATWSREFYFDVTNTTNGDPYAQIVFDMSEGGGTQNLSTATASDYILVFRSTDGTGSWTIVDTATVISATDQVVFDSVNLNQYGDGYYTLATFNYSASPLPIELIYFDAVMNYNKVDLTWSTASELNNSYFEVQRSVNGKSWQAVGIVAGNGTSVNINKYTYSDISPLNGTSYYRLKQVDYDGSETYSKIVRVVNKAKKDYVFSVKPNPSRGVFELIGDVEHPESLMLLNTVGTKVNFSYYVTSSGVSIITEGLQAGVYTLVIPTPAGYKTQKVVINYN